MEGIMKRIPVLLTMLLLISCSSTVEKPAATDTRVHKGKAVICEITFPDSNGYSEIYFDFIPDNVRDTENYLCAGCPDFKQRLRHDNSDMFHTNWIREWGIKRGNAYIAERVEHGRAAEGYKTFFDVTLKPENTTQDR